MGMHLCYSNSRPANELTLRNEDKLQALLAPVKQLSPDMCSIVRPSDPHNVLQPWEGGGQGGPQIVALHVHHLLFTGQREPQHAQGGRGVWGISPGITKLFNIGPKVGSG